MHVFRRIYVLLCMSTLPHNPSLFQARIHSLDHQQMVSRMIGMNNITLGP